MGDNQTSTFTIVLQRLQDNDHKLFGPKELLISLRYGTDHQFLAGHTGGGLYELDKVMILNMVNNQTTITITVYHDQRRLAQSEINVQNLLNGELHSFGTNLGRFTIEMLFQYSPRITNEKPNSIIEYTVMK